MTKKELQDKVDLLGQLLFEAVHLLRTDPFADIAWDEQQEDRAEQVEDFLYRCQKENIV